MRYRKLTICALLIAAVAAVMMLSSCGSAGLDGSTGTGEGVTAEEEPETIEVYAMDTYMTLSAYGEKAGKALAESEVEIKRIDAMLSTGSEDSEISKLNKSKKAEVSEETFTLIERAKTIGLDTGKVFDISVYPVMQAWGFTDKNYRVPEKAELEELLKSVDVSKVDLDEQTHKVSFDDKMAIDLGGIAKGYTSDRIMQIMKDNGVEHALINLGGNVQVLGKKPDGSDWRVAILDPENQEQYVGGVAVSDKAVITSGGYQRYFDKDGERYFHIIDLSDGFPARNGLTSVTIVSDDGTLADALSTSLFIMGPEKAADYWKKNAEDFDAVLVEDDGTVLVTEGLRVSYFSDREFEVIEK